MKPNLDLFHSPTPGSDVEDWVKTLRDRYPKGTPWFAVLDEMLKDYQRRAYLGVDLDYDFRLHDRAEP